MASRARSTIAWRMRILSGRVAAGNDERVEVASMRAAPAARSDGDDRVSALARELGAGRRADDRHARAGRAQRLERSGQLAIFELLFDRASPRVCPTARPNRSYGGSYPNDIMSRMNRLAQRAQSRILLQHAQQSRRLVSMARRGVREGARGRQADLPVHRLLDLPLVPRDGARVVRERRRRGRAQRRTSSSIKVDREERPDVDRVYMTFVQATTGSAAAGR